MKKHFLKIIENVAEKLKYDVKGIEKFRIIILQHSIRALEPHFCLLEL